MTKSDVQKLNEKQAGARSELVFIDGEAKFCSQFLGVWLVKQAVSSLYGLACNLMRQPRLALLNRLGSTGQIAILLVFLAVFGTVAPEQVLGNDTVYITNVVESSSNTGGQGRDGQDGADGTDGQDGAPGQPGQSINIDGASSAHIKLTNIVDGNVETYVTSSTTGDAVVSQDTAAAGVTEQNVASTTAQADVANEIQVTHEQQSQLHLIITSLQKLIQRYVNLLF